MNCYRTDLTFLRLLRECYFHPSRDEAFPSPKMKRMAHTAMLLLWEKDQEKPQRKLAELDSKRE